MGISHAAGILLPIGQKNKKRNTDLIVRQDGLAFHKNDGAGVVVDAEKGLALCLLVAISRYSDIGSWSRYLKRKRDEKSSREGAIFSLNLFWQWPIAMGTSRELCSTGIFTVGLLEA